MVEEAIYDHCEQPSLNSGGGLQHSMSLTCIQISEHGLTDASAVCGASLFSKALYSAFSKWDNFPVTVNLLF